jgi:hypothetical protein
VVELTLARWQPREAWHFPLCASSIRQWNRTVKREGWNALYSKSKCPHTIHYRIPDVVVEIIFTLRCLYGWGGHRMAAELKARGIWNTTGKTVYKVFDRLGLDVKVYALKGCSDGIAYPMSHRFPPGAFGTCKLASIHDDTTNKETPRYRFLRTVSQEIGQLWGC